MRIAARITGVASIALALCVAPLGAQQMDAMKKKPMSKAAKAKMDPMMRGWPKASRDAVMYMTNKYGAPMHMTEHSAMWGTTGQWKRTIVYNYEVKHDFPAPHSDSVESVIDYRVPPEKFSALAEFDGSVIAERTAGEVSARCHDEQANSLALNLMHDIVTGAKTVQEARDYYAKEFADYRRKQPTPYMDGLQFTPGDRSAADPDVRVLSDEDLENAVKEGEARG